MIISNLKNDLPKSKAAHIFISDEVNNETTHGVLASEHIATLNAEMEKWQSLKFCTENDTLYVRVPLPKKDSPAAPGLRKVGAEIWAMLSTMNLTTAVVSAENEAHELALAEGLASRNYRFEVYKKEPSQYSLKSILVSNSSAESVTHLNARLEGTFLARDLVNEPANVLTATEMANRIAEAGKKAGFDVEILGRQKIEALKMGGLLAVNQGSVQDPTFTIMEYKPKNARNQKPIAMIGKGIVYDTGGLSLKPTPNSMDVMKCDMGGAAAVIGAIYACAKAELPVHVVGLIPATDNQPGPNAYQPGDVITMYDGTTVEVMNTDAEGRLAMADALTYAKKYEPELGLDAATLTGAAMRALGYASAATMGTTDDDVMDSFKAAGQESGDRVVELPMLEDYASDLKSDIADMKNLGASPFAGAQVAGIFLKHFVDYPWIHTDIAGPAFLPSVQGHLPKGGTGFGVGLFFEFLKAYKNA